MPEWLVQMGITTILSVLKESVKNEQKKADLKKAMLKIRNAINTLYADDEDFD